MCVLLTIFIWDFPRDFESAIFYNKLYHYLGSFDLQNVTIDIINDFGKLCVTCHFTYGSNATGCVVLVPSSNNGITLQLNISRQRHVVNIMKCFPIEHVMNNSHWRAFGLQDRTLISRVPAVVGILILPPAPYTPKSMISYYNEYIIDIIIIRGISYTVFITHYKFISFIYW